MKAPSITVILLGVFALVFSNVQAAGEDRSMSFFVTSQGMGNGGNLGGLSGADAHCQKLASKAGHGNEKGRNT